MTTRSYAGKWKGWRYLWSTFSAEQMRVVIQTSASIELSLLPGPMRSRIRKIRLDAVEYYSLVFDDITDLDLYSHKAPPRKIRGQLPEIGLQMDRKGSSCMFAPTRNADFEASIRYLATDEGGKTAAARSGYRPSHNLGLDTLNDGHHEYPDVLQVNPGERARALVWLLTPELQLGRLYKGFVFTVQEGTRIVGTGEITKVLNHHLDMTLVPVVEPFRLH